LIKVIVQAEELKISMHQKAQEVRFVKAEMDLDSYGEESEISD